MDSLTDLAASAGAGAAADKRARARALIRWAALAGVVLVLLVTTSSAYLRLRTAGLGCEEWPACYGPGYSERVQVQPAARLVHRLSATAAGACVIAIIALALVDPRRMRRELLLAFALLGVTAFLAVLGRTGMSLRVPAVALGNVLGGFAMLIFFLRVALMRPPGATGSTASHVAARVALAAVFVQVALGVLTSASWSGAACAGLDACASMPAGADWRAFDPFRFAAASPLVHMTHRVASVGVALAVTLFVWQLRPRDRLACNLLALLLVAQIVVGMTLVARDLPLVAAVAHNVLAGALVLAIAFGQQRLHARP